MFYNLNGIPSELPKEQEIWFQKLHGEILFKDEELILKIDSLCANLYDLFIGKIFADRQLYYSKISLVPLWISEGGIGPELKISKEQFEKFVSSVEKDELSNKFLYYFDCSNLISTLQNSVVESNYLLAHFYEVFNENDFSFQNSTILSNGVQFVAGITVTKIFSILNYIFINLNSQLDFISKICYEYEKMESNFKTYPKLKSSTILYGNHKKLSFANQKDSVFENCASIRKILTIRSELVHNASIEGLPKVYQVIKDGHVVEKFILFPDFKDGNLKTYKNRRRFFDDDHKLNELLPELLVEYWSRLKNTLESIK